MAPQLRRLSEFTLHPSLHNIYHSTNAYTRIKIHIHDVQISYAECFPEVASLPAFVACQCYAKRVAVGIVCLFVRILNRIVYVHDVIMRFSNLWRSGDGRICAEPLRLRRFIVYQRSIVEAEFTFIISKYMQLPYLYVSTVVGIVCDHVLCAECFLKPASLPAVVARVDCGKRVSAMPSARLFE